MNLSIFTIKGLRAVLSFYLVTSLLGFAFGQDNIYTAVHEPSPTEEWNPESRYYQAMATNVRQLDTIISRENLLKVISSFERIARVEKDKALPQYYLAFALATLAFREEDIDQIDVLCDRSENALNRAESMSDVTQADILVIRAFIQYARLQVDFMGRGLEASQRAESFLRKGNQVDPGNPQVLGMLAQHYLRIPAQAGGSREKFCVFAELATKAYEAKKAGWPSGVYPIVPHWGELDLLEAQARFCYLQPAKATTKSQQP
jgi:hypothetical protein